METKKQSRKEMFEKMQSARVKLSVALAESLKDYALKRRKPANEREEESQYVSDILQRIEESPFAENIAKDLFFDLLRVLDREMTNVMLTTKFAGLTPYDYNEMTPVQFAAVIKTAQIRLLRTISTDAEEIEIYKTYYNIFNTSAEECTTYLNF